MSRLKMIAVQRGSALVVTLLIFAIGIALVVPMYSEYTLFLKRSANSFAAEQGYAYLRGGEQLAMLALKQDAEFDQQEENIRDDLSEFWAQQEQFYPLDEGGWLQGRLEDLQGRFNLNSLAIAAPQGKRFGAPQEQLIRLLQVFEEPRVNQQDAMLITEAVMDWIDTNSEPRDFGAEDDYYYDAVPPYRAANRAFVSVSELRAVAYVTAEIYAAVEPFLTVWSDGEKLNINTAAPEVLRTLNTTGDFQPLSELDVDALLELRGEAGYESVEDFLASGVFQGRELSAQLTGSLGLSSDYFLFIGEADVADRVSRLYSVLKREGQQVRTLVRASGSL